MEKEQNLDNKENLSEEEKIKDLPGEIESKDVNPENKEKNSEEKILDLEDKIARTLAEMENLKKKKRKLLNMEDLSLQKKL